MRTCVHRFLRACMSAHEIRDAIIITRLKSKVFSLERLTNTQVFSITPRDRIKCVGRLIRFGKLGYVNQVGLVSVCVRFQLPSLSRSGLKVSGGIV